jgi:outer membrane lipoprotein-sorting protein
MKHLVRLICFGLLILPGVASQGMATDNNLDNILSQMQMASRKVKTFKARLHQEKKLAQIGGREIYEGELYFKKGSGDKLRINYTKPSGQIVSVIGDKITLFQPAINQAIITSRQSQASKNQEFGFLFTPYSSIPQLKSTYNIEYLREEDIGGTGSSVISMTPKAKSAASKITLWISHSSWLPIRYQVIQKNGDIATFTLSNMSVNPIISDGVFKITFRSDTKIIEQ